MGVYAVVKMDGIAGNLYKISLIDNRVKFDLLNKHNKGPMHPNIDTLFSEAGGFKIQRDFLWMPSNELRVALGKLDRDTESIILDYIKYLFSEEDITAESTRRKLEAYLDDFYSEVSWKSEKEVDKAVLSFLSNYGFMYDGRQTTFVSMYGKKITKVIDCLGINGERTVFLVSYTKDVARDCFFDFVVNTVDAGMKIAGNEYYVTKLHETHYNFLKSLVD